MCAQASVEHAPNSCTTRKSATTASKSSHGPPRTTCPCCLSRSYTPRSERSTAHGAAVGWKSASCRPRAKTSGKCSRQTTSMNTTTSSCFSCRWGAVAKTTLSWWRSRQIATPTALIPRAQARQPSLKAWAPNLRAHDGRRDSLKLNSPRAAGCSKLPSAGLNAASATQRWRS